MTPDNSRDAAMTYAALGWPTLPTGPDKRPLTLHGVLDASTDPGTIAGWFDRWPSANVAIATGHPGPQVLDVDHPDLAPAVIAALHATAEAVTGRTDSVGRHLYFAGDEHRTRGWPWGELRGVGSYVVAPPSLHASGRPYAWTAEPTGALDPVPAAVLELVEEVDRAPFTRRVGVPHGERHGYLQRYAEQLALRGHRDEQVIAAEVEQEFARACVLEPPARTDEFRSIARWLARSELMGRLRARDNGVARLTEVLRRTSGGPSRDELEAIVARYGGWGDALDLAEVIRHGDRTTDALEVVFTNGARAFFARQGDITAPTLAKTLIAATSGVAHPPAKPKPSEFLDVYRALMLLAPPPARGRTEADEIADEVAVLLTLTEPVFGSLDDAAARFDLIATLKARPVWEPDNAARESRPALIIVGEDRYLRGGDLWTWARHRGLQIGSAAFPGRMHMAGLEQVRINGREARRMSGQRRATNTTLLYRLPVLDDVIEDDSQ